VRSSLADDLAGLAMPLYLMLGLGLNTTNFDDIYCDGEDKDGGVLNYEALAHDAKSIVDISRETASHLVKTTLRLNKGGVNVIGIGSGRWANWEKLSSEEAYGSS